MIATDGMDGDRTMMREPDAFMPRMAPLTAHRSEATGGEEALADTQEGKYMVQSIEEKKLSGGQNRNRLPR